MSSDITTVVKRYIEIWNITDAAERRSAIAEWFTDDVEYVDPNVAVQGHESLSDYIGQTQQQLGGAVFALVGDVVAHHDVARFDWNVGPAGGTPMMVGHDFAQVSDGRVRKLYGFFS